MSGISNLEVTNELTRYGKFSKRLEYSACSPTDLGEVHQPLGVVLLGRPPVQRPAHQLVLAALPQRVGRSFRTKGKATSAVTVMVVKRRAGPRESQARHGTAAAEQRREREEGVGTVHEFISRFRSVVTPSSHLTRNVRVFSVFAVSLVWDIK